MRYGILILTFLLSACVSKNPQLRDLNLKTQTLMFSKKQKITLADTSFIATLSFLNPILDEKSLEDIFILSFTPDDIALKNLEAFINGKKAKIDSLEKENEFVKYLITNAYTQHFKISLESVREESELKVKVCSADFACFELDFQKYPKSLYYRSEGIDTQYN